MYPKSEWEKRKDPNWLYSHPNAERRGRKAGRVRYVNPDPPQKVRKLCSVCYNSNVESYLDENGDCRRCLAQAHLGTM